MVVDDFQNLTGRRMSQHEAFYNLVVAQKTIEMTQSMTWDRAIALVEAHRKDEAVFFDKLMFHQLPALSRMIDPARHNPMCTPFAEYFSGATWVHIQRANVFEQTVSKYLAETLNVWSFQDAKGRDFNANMAFDLDKARAYMRSLLRQARQWQSFFTEHGIKPIQIYYEDAATNFPGYIAPLLARLGIVVDLQAAPQRRLKKVGNARNLVLAEVLRDMTLRDLATNAFEMRDFFHDRFV